MKKAHLKNKTILFFKENPSAVVLIENTFAKDSRQEYILRARLNGRTLQDIGDTLGVTKERIRQLEREGLTALQRFIANYIT